MLAREQYADLRPTWFDRFWGYVEDLLGRVLDLLVQTGQAGVIGSLLVVAALAVVIALGVRFVRRMRPSAGSREPEVAFAGRSPAEWTAEAEGHAAEGRWRDAVRCHHRALVAELSQAGLVEEVPGRTAAEYEREAAASVPGAAAAMARATRLFERAWYAHGPIGADEVADMTAAAADVLRAAGLRVPAGRA